MAYRCAFAVIVTAALCLVADATNYTHFNLCYLYFGSITDLGWTFTYNLGRLKVHDQLVLQYPNITFSSTITQNVFFADNKHEIIQRYVHQEQCSMILTNNGLLLNGEDDALASQFPSIGFLLLGEGSTSTILENFGYPNRRYVAFDYSSGYYVAGTAAAAQAPKCIAFFAAFDDSRDPTNAFAGFLLGVRSVNATVPVHVVSQGSWYFPDSDQVLSELFLKVAGCEVLARYSDPNYVDLYVAGSGVASSFSVGSHANLQQYVGDTVLTALYVDWSVPLLPLIRSWIENGTLPQSRPHIYGVKERAVIVAPVSPNAAPRAQSLATSVYERMVATQNDLVVCGTVPLRKGGFVAVDAATNCKVPYLNIGDFITDANVLQHGTYADRQQCPAGSYYHYAFKPLLTFTCTPCPPNSFSTSPASLFCSSCPAGDVSESGATRCRAVPPISGGVVAAITVAAVIFCSLVAAAWYIRRRVQRRNAAAPRQGPLCLVVTDIESCTTLWRLHARHMKDVIAQHDQIIRRVIDENNAYEVRKIGDGFVIAAEAVVDGVIVAIEIQRALMEGHWSSKLVFPGNQGDCWNGPRVSIGVHFCDEVGVTYDPLRQRFDYNGNSVRVATRVGAVAQGGQIVLSAKTLDALRADPQYDLIVSNDVHLHLWTVGAVLGTAANEEIKDNLFSMVPRELKSRAFSDCATGQPVRTTSLNGVTGTMSGNSFSSSLNSASDVGAAFNPFRLPTVVTPSDQLLQSADMQPTQHSSVFSLKSRNEAPTTPCGDGGHDDPRLAENKEPCPPILSAVQVATTLALMLRWMGPSQRKHVINSLIGTIAKHVSEEIEERDKRRDSGKDVSVDTSTPVGPTPNNVSSDSNSKDSSDNFSFSASRAATTLQVASLSRQLRNPKRLVAVAALSMMKSATTAFLKAANFNVLLAMNSGLKGPGVAAGGASMVVVDDNANGAPHGDVREQRRSVGFSEVLEH